ncbi:putative non-F420 flavinoid oxidoreductase [Deinobacterium chartae]|uniref:Putative non-F420 flavinoid oxidoreductase n=1 Tax=Deinobacterium chartae TaxID=521158 RepID=A0A841I3P9_9DEIO|nr:TIGR03885 family FMN-dependent LLM class oxidoreductase [Deinobacterium chartae]MBB6098998.1 putative non-F420 flavinoid oxidoreductase [Deinobacterium chartae]
MARIGYHASHEQFAPSALLHYVRAAEASGWDAAMCSDHFHPWTDAQGHSGFAWSWLGAALATTSLDFGMVCAPGQRYHPAIIAQAAATLSEMFEGRLWCAFGSGQNLNEHITGERWPAKDQRNARLEEAVSVIRALWSGEEVTFRGRFVTVEQARLYSRPERPPLIYGAAITPQTARWVASWADGLITVVQTREKLRQVVEAFLEGGGEGKPMSLQVHVAYAPSEQEALEAAHRQWAFGPLPSAVNTELSTPAQFEAACALITPEQVKTAVRISSDLEQHAAWLREDLELGFDRLYLHEVGPAQERFIEAFGRRVLPALR